MPIVEFKVIHYTKTVTDKKKTVRKEGDDVNDIQLFKLVLTNTVNGTFEFKTVKLVVEEDDEKMLVAREYDNKISHHYRLHKILKRKLNQIESPFDTECLHRVSYRVFTQDEDSIEKLKNEMLTLVERRIEHHKAMILNAERSLLPLLSIQK